MHVETDSIQQITTDYQHQLEEEAGESNSLTRWTDKRGDPVETQPPGEQNGDRIFSVQGG